tara:strand:- start:1367 stop:1924 length:558 start_codon:yes stop_codon:yes gene_type:complete
MLGLGNSISNSSFIEASSSSSFDKTFSFDSNVEGWSRGDFAQNAVVSQQASHTPSNDSEKTGILVIQRENNSNKTYIDLDLSSLSGYDSSSVLYYELVYSIPSANPSGITYTGLDKVQNGSNGSSDDYTAVNPLTFNTWITVNGDLDAGGVDDLLSISFDPFSFTFVSGAKIFIDRIRVSHTDFR